MDQHEKINYLEFPAKDMMATKRFFNSVFGWEFTDYGPAYSAFSHAGINGGFFVSKLNSSTHNGSALVVFYSKDIQQTLQKITKGGGEIVKDIFSFPGGCRFHFTDPNGNEFAVWSEASAPN